MRVSVVLREVLVSCLKQRFTSSHVVFPPHPPHPFPSSAAAAPPVSGRSLSQLPGAVDSSAVLKRRSRRRSWNTPTGRIPLTVPTVRYCFKNKHRFFFSFHPPLFLFVLFVCAGETYYQLPLPFPKSHVD